MPVSGTGRKGEETGGKDSEGEDISEQKRGGKQSLKKGKRRKMKKEEEAQGDISDGS